MRANPTQLANVTRSLDKYFSARQMLGRTSIVVGLQNRIIINGLTDSKIKQVAKLDKLEGGGTFEELQDLINRITNTAL
jgi:hypothetical protein